MNPNDILKAPKCRTEYQMVESGTEDIGKVLTALAEDGWYPMGSHQSYISPGDYSKHSILLMRVVPVETVKLNPPPTVEYRK